MLLLISHSVKLTVFQKNLSTTLRLIKSRLFFIITSYAETAVILLVLVSITPLTVEGAA